MSLLPKFSTLILSTVLLMTTLQPLDTQAYPTCGDLFRSRNEGALTNRAAHAEMLRRLRLVLPAGRHEVTVDGNILILNVSYSALGEVQMMLNSYSLITSQSTPLITGVTGNQSGTYARIQIIPNNAIIITNTKIFGDVKKSEGLTTREIEMKFDLDGPNRNVVNLKETVTTESDFYVTRSYTVRSDLVLKSPAPTSPHQFGRLN